MRCAVSQQDRRQGVPTHGPRCVHKPVAVVIPEVVAVVLEDGGAGSGHSLELEEEEQMDEGSKEGE